MCWRCDKLKIKRAKQDILVWKIVTYLTDNSCDNICKSLYAGHIYLKDKLEITPIEFEVERNGIIGSTGFHSYSNKLKWEKDDGFILIYKKKIFSNFKNYINSISQYNVRIARFHIPKGYQYAENKNGEIISSAIVFDSFID